MNAFSTYESSTNIASSDYSAFIMPSSNVGDALWKEGLVLQRPIVDLRPSTQGDDSPGRAYGFDFVDSISQGDDLNSIYVTKLTIPLHPGVAGDHADGGVILVKWSHSLDFQAADATIPPIPFPSSARAQGRIAERYSDIMALRNSHPEVIKRIEYLASLGPDWDGYRARVVSPVAVQKCLRLLNTIDRELFSGAGEPFVAPMADGGLELEWELACQTEITLAIPPDGTIVRYVLTTFDQAGNAEDQDGLLSEGSGINELLSSVLS